MALTQEEKDEVYLTVSTELVKMFDILSNVYYKPHHSEQAQLIKEIETDIRTHWDHFYSPD